MQLLDPRKSHRQRPCYVSESVMQISATGLISRLISTCILAVSPAVYIILGVESAPTKRHWALETVPFPRKTNIVIASVPIRESKTGLREGRKEG